jgi:hypothetical protein
MNLLQLNVAFKINVMLTVMQGNRAHLKLNHILTFYQ